MPAVVRRTDINEDGAPIVRVIQRTVFANFLEVSVDGSIVSDHAMPPPPPEDEESQEVQPPGHAGVVTTGGSTNVFVEGKPVNRITDEDSCAHVRVTGSPNVFVGANKPVKGKDPALKPEKDTAGKVSDRGKFTESTGPNGERILTFENGNQVAVDSYGNKIMSSTDRNGQVLYYIQPEQAYYLDLGGSYGKIEAWGPAGPLIYTDAVGNVVPSVTYSANSLELGPGGLRYVDPTTVTQTVPAGDPLPDNKNKW